MTEILRIQAMSDQDHEDLIVEINFGDQFVAIVNQEKGPDLPEIEVHPRPDGKPWVFNLHEFFDALSAARARLNALRRSRDCRDES